MKKVGKERMFGSVHATVTFNEICNRTKIELGRPWLISIFPVVLLFKSRQFQNGVLKFLWAPGFFLVSFPVYNSATMIVFVCKGETNERAPLTVVSALLFIHVSCGCFLLRTTWVVLKNTHTLVTPCHLYSKLHAPNDKEVPQTHQ